MATISSDVIRGYNDTIILSILQEEPSYGYAISKAIRDISEGKYVIKETTLYSAFTRLVKNGLVESYSDVGADNGKRRTYYRITPEGMDFFKARTEEWELTKDVVERFIRMAEESKEQREETAYGNN